MDISGAGYVGEVIITLDVIAKVFQRHERIGVLEYVVRNNRYAAVDKISAIDFDITVYYLQFFAGSFGADPDVV